MRKLPPLHSLQCFEATAKFGTVREASNQLCISPSAVSHQIAKLEEYLDSALFHRQNKRLVLTDTGYNYFKQIERALESIEEATWDSLESPKVEHLTVSLPPSFSSLWLIPKLKEFLENNTDINIKLTDNLTIDECLNSVDCAVEYRFGAAQDRFSKMLFSDEIVPLASPAYIADQHIGNLVDMKGKTLIITERRFHSWKALLKDYPWIDFCQIISVRYTYQALNAAVAGLGVALGNYRNAEYFINNNQLVSPFDIPRSNNNNPQYIFSCTNEALLKPKVQRFYNWIMTFAEENNGVSK